MHTITVHTDTRSHRVNTIVVALHGNLGALTRHAGNLLDGNQTIGDLWHLLLKQTLQERRTGT